jgi:hypothetical protein
MRPCHGDQRDRSLDPEMLMQQQAGVVRHMPAESGILNVAMLESPVPAGMRGAPEIKASFRFD